MTTIGFDDVHRIELPTPIRIGPANAYLPEGDPTLVDAGPLLPDSLSALEDGLAELGTSSSSYSSVRGRKGIAAFFTGSYEVLVPTESGWRFPRRLVTIDYADEGQMPLATILEAR